MLELHLQLDTIGFAIQDPGMRGLHCFFDYKFRPIKKNYGAGGTTQVPTISFLELIANLYSVNENVLLRDELSDYICDNPREAEGNSATYLAAPSDDPNAPWSFDFEVLDIGEYDYEDAVMQAKEHSQDRTLRAIRRLWKVADAE